MDGNSVRQPSALTWAGRYRFSRKRNDRYWRKADIGLTGVNDRF
jgi:hypothetical protein